MMNSLVFEMAQKLSNQLIISLQGCARCYSPVAFYQQPTETTEYKLGIRGSDIPQKAALAKADW